MERRSTLIPEAPLHRRGYWEARPGDVVGRREFLFVDVRPERDLVGDLGHIHGVTLTPSSIVHEQGLTGIDAHMPVVLVCGNGRTSADCAEALVSKHGFRDVYLLVGGMIRWNAEGRPIAKKPTWTPR